MNSTLADVSFLDTNLENILNEMIVGYEQAYLQQTGKKITLYPGDKIRIFLYTQALREYQLRLLINYKAKQNLLKYAEGEQLDELLLLTDTKRLNSSKAFTTERFKLTQILNIPETIPKGTRVTAGNDLYFETNENIEIPVGTSEIDVLLYCNKEGVIGNGFKPGQINSLVDPLYFIHSVTNITESQGGADIENDKSFKERGRLSPSKFSVAGPTEAYKYFAKEFNASVGDVAISSPSPGVVDLRVILNNGEIPNSTFLNQLKDYLSDKRKRPLTDNLKVDAPNTISYDVELTYYISNEKIAFVEDIKKSVNEAINDFITWQKNKIGRDINPSKLIADIIKAGATRVDIIKPQYLQLNDLQVASINNTNIVYGGLSND